MAFQNTVDDKIQDILSAYDDESKFVQRNSKVCQIEHGGVFHCDWEQRNPKLLNATLQNSSIIQSTRTINPNDEASSCQIEAKLSVQVVTKKTLAHLNTTLRNGVHILCA
ncbi:hypothetical protein CVS40_5376 [Lucilia cuprina]|nr:hypothetical protein CVS40_5376 [Lucilia cuprina]